MSEPFMALALGKENAIADWRALIGPTHVYKAAWEKPESLRARYGISGASYSGALVRKHLARKPAHLSFGVRHAKRFSW